MKRNRHAFEKMTSSELLAAGHVELAEALRDRLKKTIELKRAGTPMWQAKKNVKPSRRFVLP